MSDDSFLILLNAHGDDVTFVLPGGTWGELWVTEVDTALRHTGAARAAGAGLTVGGRSMQLLRRV